jgi:hypothetical protein
VVVVKLFNFVSLLSWNTYIYKKIDNLVEHQIELGTESLHGEISNNPLYQLAEEHQLIDIDDSKIAR